MGRGDRVCCSAHVDFALHSRQPTYARFRAVAYCAGVRAGLVRNVSDRGFSRQPWSFRKGRLGGEHLLLHTLGARNFALDIKKAATVNAGLSHSFEARE